VGLVHQAAGRRKLASRRHEKSGGRPERMPARNRSDDYHILAPVLAAVVRARVVRGDRGLTESLPGRALGTDRRDLLVAERGAGPMGVETIQHRL